MTYRFKHGDASVQEGLRRIAIDQIDKAIEEVDDRALGVHNTVHQVRKRCKKLRGLIRLVRPVFDKYDAENDAFRGAARALSFLRDSEALIETYDDLVEAYDEQIERPAFASIRRRLTLRQKEAEENRNIEQKLSEFREWMSEARNRARRWRLDEDDFDALAGGLAKTYKRARKAMARAKKEPTAGAFHEWRKRVKYHCCHARLLRPIWPHPMRAHRDAADELSNVLGDHHDLAVFRQTLAADPSTFGEPGNVEVMFGLVHQRQAALEAEAFSRGARLLAEPTSALTRRWKTHWEAWRDERLARQPALAA